MTINKRNLNIELARKGWTRGDLADACGYSRSRLYVVLAAREVTPAAAGRVAAALGVNVADIVDMDE